MVIRFLVLISPIYGVSEVWVDGRVGKDNDSCGAKSAPCKTIGAGVAASDGSSSVTVYVNGGGGDTIYKDDCSEIGIAIPFDRNVAIEGVDGMPVIDCGGKGSLFTVSAPTPQPKCTDKLANLKQIVKIETFLQTRGWVGINTFSSICQGGL